MDVMLPSCILYAYIVLGNQKRESHAATMGARTQVPEEQRVLLTTEPSICLPSSLFFERIFSLVPLQRYTLFSVSP